MSHEDTLVDLVWEELEWLSIDSGQVGFADVRAHTLVEQGARVQGLTYDPADLGSIGPYPCAVWVVGDDGDAPIEVARDADGVVFAIRVETVNDVADLDGAWRPKAEIEFPTGRIAVCDPGCRSDFYWHPVDVRPGRYRSEWFVPTGDLAAGFRIVWTGPAELTRRTE